MLFLPLLQEGRYLCQCHDYVMVLKTIEILIFHCFMI